MYFLGTLGIVAALCGICRNAIKDCPLALYLVAIVLDVFLLIVMSEPVPKPLLLPASILLRRGGLAVSLFVIVMFIGVLPRESRVSRWFRPIRAELSIAACILIAGHMGTYLAQYATNLFAYHASQAYMIPAFIVALFLLLLTVLLGATSLRVVKRHMSAASWRRLQGLAYVFYALVYLHVFLLLGPSAFRGSQPALTNVIVYSAIFGIYAVLRIWRAHIDRKNRINLDETVTGQGFRQEH